MYDSVRALTATGTSILASGGGKLAYSSMAALGLATPFPSPGLSLDAVGSTGTSKGGQVVLGTLAAGNTSSAKISTDRRDYLPGDTVTLSGTGWASGETVTVNLHEDPLVHDDRMLTAVADASGSFTNRDFAPEAHDFGLRFVLTATGETSGMRAQTTFTDGDAKDGDGTMTVSPDSLTAGQSGVTLTFTFAAPSGGDFGSNSKVYVVVPAGWTTPQKSNAANAGYVTITSTSCSHPSVGTGSDLTFTGNTINITQNCAAKAGFTLAYGNAATSAPSATGLYTFSTSTDNSAVSGSAKNIAVQPFVTVKIGTTTALSLTSGANPSKYGQSLTFAASVTPSAATGTVSFYDGGTCAAPGSTLASAVALSGGQASFSTSTLSLGTHTILACYSGSAAHYASSASTTQTVNAAEAADGYGTMTVSPTSASAGQTPVTLTFTFAVPSGNYAFSDGSKLKIVIPSGWTPPQNGTSGAAGYAQVSSSNNTCPAGAPASGTVSVTVSGDTIVIDHSCDNGNQFQVTFSGVTAPLSVGPATFTALTDNSGVSGEAASIAVQPAVTVNKASTTTTVTSGTNPSTYGQSVTFTATVAPQYSGTPTGTVSFYDGGSSCTSPGTLLAGAVELSGGQASTSSSSLSAATHTIRACYGGDASFNSGGGSVSQVVAKASQTITFTSTAPSNAVFGGPTYTVTATASSGLTVTFGSSTSSVCTVSGSTVSFVGVGTCTVTASQSGNTNYLAAPQVTQSFTVSPAEAADGYGTMTVSPTSVNALQTAVTLTFTFAVPSGNYAFSDSSTVRIVVPSGWTAPQTAASGAPGYVQVSSSNNTCPAGAPASGTASVTVAEDTITVGQSCNNGQQFRLTYGNVTAPAAGGPYVFTTLTDNSGVPGDADSIAVQPSVTVNKLATTTTASRTAGATPSAFGDLLTFAATVAPSAATGTVSFYDGGTCAAPGSTLAGSVALSGGQATFSTAALSGGSHTILACYSGDATYNASSGSIAQAVNALQAADGYGTIAVSPTGVTAGQNNLTLSFTFQVPAGGYDFANSSKVNIAFPSSWTAPVNDPGGNGDVTITSATCSGLSTGRNNITISGRTVTVDHSCDNGQQFVLTYSKATAPTSLGAYTFTTTTDNAGVSGSAQNVAVQPIVTVYNSSSTSLSRTSGTNPSTYGQSLTFTATVSPSAATGTVSFYDGGTCAAPGSTLASTVALSGGQASFSTPAGDGLSPGSHTILTCYSGNATYIASSASISQTVNAAQAADGTGTMTVTPASVTVNQSGVTLTFTFAVPAGNYDFANSSTVKIVVPSGWPTPQDGTSSAAGYVRISSETCSGVSNGTGNTSVSGNTITVTHSCDSGEQFVLLYGNAATAAPATAGSYTFTTSTDNSSPSLGTPQPIAVQPAVTVNGLNTTTTVSLTAGTNPSAYGQSLTFTASVAPSAATGTVSVYDGGTCAAPGSTLAGSVALSGGQASFSTSALSGGSHTIRACYSGDASYNASSGTATHTVNQVGQTITFTSAAPSNAVVAGPTYTVTATGGASGNPVTFGTATPLVCTVSGSTVSFVGAGSCTVTADQAGNATYAAAPQATQSFAVGQAAQTISFTSTAPGDAVINGPTYTATATASSGLAVTFGSATPLVCTVSGNAVSMVGAGSCTVTADQTGNANYLAASQVTQSFTVTNPAQAIIFTSTAPTSAVVNGPTYTVTATGGASGNPVTFGSAVPSVCTVSASTVSFTGAGTCTVTADQAGNGTYQPAPQATQSFTVGKGTATLTLSDLSHTYDGTPKAATVTTSPAGLTAVTVTYYGPSTATEEGSTTPPTNAGDYTVVATLSNANYQATDATGTLHIAKASQTISFGALSGKTFGDADFTVSATATSGLAVSFTASGDCTVTGDLVHMTGAESCTVTANQPGNANYDAAANVPQSFTIGQAASSTVVTFEAGPYGYRGSAFTATAQVTGAGGLAAPVTVGYSGDCTTVTSANGCTATATFAGDANHTGSSDSKSITITKANASIPVNGYSGIYDGAAHGATGSATGALSEDLSSLLHLGASFTDVPGGTASWTFDGTTNYNASSGTAPIAITKATPTVSASATNATYTGSPYAGGSGSAKGVLNENLTPAVTLRYAGSGATTYGPSATAPTGAGTYTVRVSFIGNVNYTAGGANAAFTINQASQAITITSTAPANAVYSGPTYTVTATGGGSSNAVTFGTATPTVCSVAANVVSFGGVGDCTITANQQGNVNYLAAAQVTQTFTVGKATPTITWSNPAGITYGTALSATQLNATPSVAGSLVYTPALGTVLNAGNGQTLHVAFTPTDADNYNAASKDVTINVARAPLNITVDPKSTQYSDPLPAFTGSVGGVQNGDNLTLSYGTAATMTSQPGTYAITYTILDPDGKLGNYSYTPSSGTLTVTKEDARSTWSGLMYYSTASTSSSSANVTLQATIQDITAVPTDPATDAYPGAILTSVVRFVNRDAGNAVLCTAALALVTPGDAKTAIASCAWTANIGNGDAVQFTIGVQIGATGGNYGRDNPAENVVITVAKPLSGFTAGGGYVVNQASAGSYAGDPGLKTNFGFGAKLNRSGTNLQGGVNIIVRRGGRVYQIKSTAINSLSLQASPTPPGGTAQFVSKANLTDVTNPLAPISLGGNYTLQMTVNDQGEPGSSDLIGFQLTSGSTLLFSSSWSSARTNDQLLGGGNVQVR